MPKDKSNTDYSLIKLDDNCLGGIIHVHTGKMKQAEEQQVTCPNAHSGKPRIQTQGLLTPTPLFLVH